MVVVIACGITYMIVTNNNKTETKEENNNNNNNEQNNNQEEQISLSEEELKQYLSYVPNELENMTSSVYKQKITTLNTVDKNLLRNIALIISSECLNKEENNCPFDTSVEIPIKIDLFPYYENNVATKYIPLNYLNEILHKVYNYKLVNVENTVNAENIINAGGMGYIYQDGYFILVGGGSTSVKHINLIENYEANNENLIIYEYATYFDPMENKLFDYYTEKETVIDDLLENITYEEKIIILKDYLKEHKDKFTLYKHTFKKNDTGYYWYSTEVA